MDNIWLFHPELYSSLDNESRKYILHPKLSEYINQSKNIKLLDFGCGDGSFIKNLSNNLEISLYDISSKALAEAKSNLKDYNIKTYYELDEIPNNNFDYVILSLVLMTIDNKDDILNVLNKIYSSLSPTGTLLIAITHPCFRNCVYSTFQTDYSKNKNFNYFNEGEKFEVFLRDNKKTVSFFDFHWTLSTTINLIIESNFRIKKIEELKDKSDIGKYFNSNFSPYMIIECVK